MATLAELSVAGEVAASTSGTTATPIPSTAEASASQSAAQPSPTNSVAHWAAPPETVYPDKAVPNPSINSTAEPPACTNLPRGALYRPARLPADYDDRLNVESIWMGLQKTSNKAVYFLPNACQRCSGNARFCDRGLPACSSCTGKPWPCVPGKHWATLRPKPKPRLSKATNYSAMSPAYIPAAQPVASPGAGGHASAHAYAHAPAHASAHPQAHAHTHVHPQAQAQAQASPSHNGSRSAQPAATVSQSNVQPLQSPTPLSSLADARPPAASPQASAVVPSLQSRQSGSAVTNMTSTALSSTSNLAANPGGDVYRTNGASPPRHHQTVNVPDLNAPIAPISTPTRFLQVSSSSTPTGQQLHSAAPGLPTSVAATEHATVPHTNQPLSSRLASGSSDVGLLTAGRASSSGLMDTPPRLHTAEHSAESALPSRAKTAADVQPAVDAGMSTPAPGPAAAAARPVTRPRPIDTSSDEDSDAYIRAAKKRRISTPDEAKQEEQDVKSSTPARATASTVKKRVSRVSRNQPTALTVESHPDEPYTSSDAAYFERIEKNLKRRAFKSMKHACPVWANTRMALQASTEYFRSPRRTAGASVEIGLGGVARGVVLEGEAPAHRYLWGTGEQIGTLILPIGHSRPSRRINPDAQAVIDEEAADIVPGPTSPKINVLSDVRLVDPETGASKVAGESEPEQVSPSDTPPYLPEEECIEALFMAQRAGVPVALAVTKDYSLAPFQVPRGICGLGWFFVVDSWLESSDIHHPDKPYTVQWLFRFEFCNGNARLPWWQEEEDKWERMPIPTLVITPLLPIPLSGPGVHGSCTSIGPGDRFPVLDGIWKAGTVHRCDECGRVAKRVLKGEDRCVNEYCRWFMFHRKDVERWGAGGYTPLGEMEPLPVAERFVMEPAALGLRLRGVKPGVCAIPAPAGEHGKDFWRGWICDKCGMANERRKWKGWECEGCKNHHSFLRSPIQLSSVRNSNRPICTGPRIDNGFPNFPFDKTSSWSLFDNLGGGRMKIVKHVLSRTPQQARTDIGGPSAPGVGQAGSSVQEDNAAGVLHHSLYSPGADGGGGTTSSSYLGEIWKDLQAQGKYEMRFKRIMLLKASRRPFERYLCPYYTEAFGPFIPILTEALPHDSPTPWAHSPGVVLDWMFYINERASDMFAGTPEFNSLLILVTPPLSVNAYQPKFTVQKADRLILTNLGSEMTVKIRKSCKGKAAEVIMQHGDVFGVHAREEDIELQLKADGFAFVGIARQAYKTEPEPGLGAIWDPQKPETWRMGRDGLKDDNEVEEESGPGSTSGLGLMLGETGSSTAAAEAGLVNGTEANIDNLPPPLPTTYDENPLRGWYMGPRPLDGTQRMRRGPPLFERPAEETFDEDDEESEEEEGWDTNDSAPAYPAETTAPHSAPAAKDAELDDNESLYSQEPTTPTLVRAEIPPSPTAPNEEDDADQKAAAEAEAAAKAADKKAKRKKRQSEPAPTAIAITQALAPGSSHKGSDKADNGDDKRPDRKRARMSEPAPKETTVETKGKGKNTAGKAVQEVGANKGKGKEKQAAVTATVPESNAVVKRSHKRKSDVAGIINGASAGGTPSKSHKRDKGKGNADAVATTAAATAPSTSSSSKDKDQEREKKKPRTSRAKVKPEEAPSPAFAADGGGAADRTMGDGVAEVGGTPVKLKLNVGNG